MYIGVKMGIRLHWKWEGLFLRREGGGGGDRISPPKVGNAGQNSAVIKARKAINGHPLL